MTVWSDWNWLMPAAPWIGAVLLLLIGLLSAAGLWARWQPAPDEEDHGLPWLLRWGPALALGGGCALVVWLVAPMLEPDARAGAAVAVLVAVSGLCAVLLGRAGDRAARLVVENAFWRLNAEGVATHLRRVLQRDVMLADAAKALMTELEATSVRLFFLNHGHFELAASVPPAPSQPEPFERECLVAQAFRAPGRAPILEIANPLTGRPGNWSKKLRQLDAQELKAEQQRLESLGAEAGVGLWRASTLVGFFLIGGRLTSDPFSAAQKLFVTEVSGEIGRMLDVLEAAEGMAREIAQTERAKADRDMATSVRRLMPPPDISQVTGLEYGVSVEIVAGGFAGFCDVVALPGSALGIAMAETSACGLQIAVEMVRLQALLRSRFYVYGEDLREMLDSVERALLGTERSPQPIRLLLGRYDAIGRRLVYVNAGYPPPILLKNRRDGSETRRLAVTGRPLTGEGPADWKVEEIELRRKDLLLAISPGLLSQPEALDKWSENRLLETMLDLEKLPAPAIAHRLVREATGCDDGQPSHRERSVVVLRPGDSGVRLPSAPQASIPRQSTETDYLRRE